MTRVPYTDGCARSIAVGDTVHVRGVVKEVGWRTTVLVKFDFFGTSLYVGTSNDIVHHEPAQLKVGDKVQSKDSRVGTIRYIEDDWALVVETHRCKAIRYLIDLQRAP